MAELGYWIFCGSFLVALALHLCGSLLIATWMFRREDSLIDWHGNVMLAALLFGTCGALGANWFAGI